MVVFFSTYSKLQLSVSLAVEAMMLIQLLLHSNCRNILWFACSFIACCVDLELTACNCVAG